MPHPGEQRGEVQGGRQQPRGRAGGAVALGTDEPQRAVAPQPVVEPGPPAEVEEVRAAAHGHVLAGVHEPAAHGILERRGAAAGAASRLEHRDGQAGLGEGRGRGQTGETAADDRDAGRTGPPGGSCAHVHRHRSGPQTSVVAAAARSAGRGGRTRAVKMAVPARRTRRKIAR